jgi:type I restriction enzyme S subunit
MKKYDSYKSSGVEWIGEIPEHWGISKMKFENEIVSSSIDKKEHEGYEKHLIIHYNDVIKNTKIYNHNITEFGFCSNLQYQNFKVNKGDIILTKDSMDIKNICDSTIVIDNIDNCVFGYHLYKLTTKKEKLNSLFLFYFLNSKNVKKYFLVNSNGTTIIGVSKNLLENTQIITPPLQEQEQIVNYLDEKTKIIDKLISTKQRKVELLKEQRTTLINQVITKGLNPNVKMKDSGVECIGEIPESWSFVRLGVLGNFSKGKGITKDKIKENGFPCIRNGEIYTTYNLRFSEPKSFIDEITITESIKVKKGTLFFTGDGETLEEIGKCVVYLGEEEIYVGGGINVFTPKTNKVSPIYLSYVMSSTSCVYQKSIGGKGEIVVHIYSKQLRDVQFGLPKLEQQQEIVEYLDKQTKDIDNLVSMEQNKMELLKEYRQSLISEVITGKIKVY